MKILDRYVLFTFLKNYVLSFMILIGLYIVLDMLFNFDDLMSVQTREGLSGFASWTGLVKTIFDYYFYQTFLIFTTMSGIIPIVAASFTLMRMSRQNELSAILSAGVPLLRVARPIIFGAVILNAILIVDQEVVVPVMIPKLMRSHNEAGQDSSKSFQIGAMQDDRHNIVQAAKFYPDPKAPYMREVQIIECNDQMLPMAWISAKEAHWQPDVNGGQWDLVGAQRLEGLQPGAKPHIDPDYRQPYKSNLITPEEISLYRYKDYVNLLPTERINQLLMRPNAYGINQLLRVKHTRFTQWLMNIIMLLLAIPSVLTRTPGNLKAAAMKCLVYSGLCMATTFVSTMLASQPQIAGPGWQWQWPAIMAWVPIIIFGPCAVYLLDTIES